MNYHQEDNMPNLEQLMQLGIQSARNGNTENARVIFQQVLDADKQNERAWLWMAAVAETPVDRLRYLNTVLRINPNHPTALREIEQMQAKQESSVSQAMRYGFLILTVIVVLIVLAVAVLMLA
jgi:cytochrome c-type biogenesis protein CcmH/NrfG